MDNWDDDMNTYQTHAGTTFSSSTTTTDFSHYYSAYSLSHISNTNHETGNKIIMPPSALNQLGSLSIAYPMLFRIENATTSHHSHCGVVEFTADEGFVFLPTWMMNNMQLQEGELVNIKNTTLPKGKYIKIQPHGTKFTTISDHKSVLEKAFREFVCLTTGDTIVINHGDEKYMINIVETKPSPAILLFETDCEVDFALPLDYKEKEKKTTGEDTKNKDSKPFKPLTGVGRRVDGQPLTAVAADQEMVQSNVQVNVKIKEEGFKAFTGKSYRLY